MSKLLRLPSLRRLREVLAYDPVSGVFTWRKRISIRIHGVGAVAGNIGSDGYLRLGVDGKRFKAHRIAYLMGTGVEWHDDLDHINGNRLDNSIENLRPANRKINGQNHRKADVDSKTGVLGVTERDRKFVAQIGAGGRNHYLGRFKTKQAAHAAYVKAKRKLHEGCTL